MLISCPKCMAVYDIATDRIPEQGRRFKCIECGNVWTVLPRDVKNMEPENKVKAQRILPSGEEVVQKDIQEMFKRLSRDTDALFTDTEKYTTKITENSAYTKQPQRASDRATNTTEIIKRKLKMFFSPLMLNGMLLLMVVFLTSYIGYHHRYEIVRLLPMAENFYDNLKINSIYTGRDIVFDHLNVKPLVRGRNHFIEISGRLLNQGKYKVKLLPVKAIMYNAKGKILAQDVKEIPLPNLMPQTSSIFFFILENKTTEAKVVELSFVP